MLIRVNKRLLKLGSIHSMVLTSLLVIINTVWSLYIVVNIPLAGAFSENKFDTDSITKFILISSIQCNIILIFAVLIRKLRYVDRPLRVYKVFKSDSVDHKRHPALVSASLIIAFIIYSLEWARIVLALSGKNSFIDGGDYYNLTSGLSEYIVVPLAIHTRDKLLKSSFSRLETLLYISFLLEASFLLLYGMRASASVIFVFLLIIVTIWARKRLLFAKSLHILFIGVMISFVLGSSILGSLRLASVFHMQILPPINQFTETLNTSLAIASVSNEPLLLRENPITILQNLFTLTVPQSILGLEAALNILLPYNSIIESGYNVGGGGYIYSHYIYLFGPLIGFILVVFALLALILERLSRVYTIAISLLSIRFFMYDPISSSIRAFLISTLVYIIAIVSLNQFRLLKSEIRP